MENDFRYDIFISYSRKDTESAKEIFEALTQAGFSCFFDENLDEPNVWDVIVREIENCKVFLYLGSKNTAAARITPKELTYAINHKDRSCIFPYFIDDSELPKVHEFLLSDINWKKRINYPIETGLIPSLKKILQEIDVSVLGLAQTVNNDISGVMQEGRASLSELYDELMSYKQCISREDCVKYLEKYPNGKYYEEIKIRLWMFEKPSVGFLTGFTDGEALFAIAKFFYSTLLICEKKGLSGINGIAIPLAEKEGVSPESAEAEFNQIMKLIDGHAPSDYVYPRLISSIFYRAIIKAIPSEIEKLMDKNLKVILAIK